MSRIKDSFLDTVGLTAEQLEQYGEGFAVQQRGVNWWIGDVARHAKYGLHLGDNAAQVFPEWVSPGLIDRCEAVALAYPNEEDRHPGATWSQHKQVAKDPDRKEIIQWMVDEGLTSDEARKRLAEERAKAKAAKESGERKRWLLAMDVNYYVHRHFFSGAGIEAASQVAEWFKRTVDRLKERKLTDVVCCVDSKINHRKELTKAEDWDGQKYKDRPQKEVELGPQLELASKLLREKGFLCVCIEGMEADDVMASYAKQFDGLVTLLTQDKDARQCLSAKCNMLLDIEWENDATTGNLKPKYRFVSAKKHTEEGLTYNSVPVKGITPAQWCDFQMLVGDSTDGVQGAEGIGAKIAMQLIVEYGTVEAAIARAKLENEWDASEDNREELKIKPAKRAALVKFEPFAATTRKLVTLVDNLDIPKDTRI